MGTAPSDWPRRLTARPPAPPSRCPETAKRPSSPVMPGPDERCVVSDRSSRSPYGRVRCGVYFLVSQKISAIWSIFASSSSATCGSALPLAPEAPASFVASLTSVCSCGYFSKCGGLK